jgi:hypothetical protein
VNSSYSVLAVWVQTKEGSSNDKSVIETDSKENKWEDLGHGSEWNGTDEHESVTSHDAQQDGDDCCESQQTARANLVSLEENGTRKQAHDDKDNRQQRTRD